MANVFYKQDRFHIIVCFSAIRSLFKVFQYIFTKIFLSKNGHMLALHKKLSKKQEFFLF